MKIVRFAAQGKVKYGILNGQSVQGIDGKPFGSVKPAGDLYKLNQVRLLAPCLPSKIVAMGLNYKPHARELNAVLPEEPLIFLKPPTSVIGPEDNIVYPPSSKQVDYEGELTVVIRKRAWQVSQEDALDYVLGYTCLNDVTARDIQTKDGQWTRAKSFDTFAPMGPWIETELNPGNVTVETFLNGQLKQQASTKELIFNIPTQISFISHVMTLLPGDVISTGTPGGIGPMNPGDTVEIKISSIDTLRNYVVKDDGRPHKTV